MVPVLLETARLLEQWAQANPDSTEIPRAIGTLRYQLGDMKAVDTLLNTEQVQALSAPLAVRVQRRGNRLERE